MSALVLLFVTLAVTMSEPKRLMFVPVQDSVSNSFLCADDPPSAVLSLASPLVGVPIDVPEDVACGYSCTGLNGCTSYNVRTPQDGSSFCEFYTYVPRYCSRGTYGGQCKHYEVRGLSASCESADVTTKSTPDATTTLPTTVLTLNPESTYAMQDLSGGISSVTSCGGYLYVIRAPKSTNQIAVYNATSFQFLRYITVTEASGNLYGLAISPSNDYLFVSDYDNSYVFKVNMSSQTNIKWSVATNPNGLTINRQNNLMVASASKTIQEYTTAGVLVRTFIDGNRLNDVKELGDGTLAISRYGPVYGVARLSNNGSVLYSYGSTTSGSGPGQMNWPGMLAVNSQGYLIVAESGNNRVSVLEPTLSQARTVPLPISGLNGPYGIWLDEARGLLYVGEYGSPYRLLVFSNVYNLNSPFAT